MMRNNLWLQQHPAIRADGKSIRQTLRTDIYRMIKLNFIRELVGKVEAGGITNFCKKKRHQRDDELPQLLIDPVHGSRLYRLVT